MTKALIQLRSTPRARLLKGPVYRLHCSASMPISELTRKAASARMFQPPVYQ